MCTTSRRYTFDGGLGNVSNEHAARERVQSNPPDNSLHVGMHRIQIIYSFIFPFKFSRSCRSLSLPPPPPPTTTTTTTRSSVDIVECARETTLMQNHKYNVRRREATAKHIQHNGFSCLSGWEQRAEGTRYADMPCAAPQHMSVCTS